MPDVKEVINGLEMSYKYSNVDENNTLVPQWIVLHAITLLKAQEPITGETSDGYHTFNELYHHRAVLFSVIVANYPDRAWKSKKHHDGTMYDNMFIVGIDTPNGQATYHYDVDPYWDMFKCRVLDNAPEWDGHTPAQAIERIGKLKEQEPVEMHPAVDAVPVVHGRWINYPECLRYESAYCEEDIVCSECHSVWNIIDNDADRFDHCPACGAKMDGDT